MERFDYKNFQSLEKLYFHDAELGDIRISYKDNQVVIQLHDVEFEQANRIDVEMTFSGVVDIQVPMKEPWGGGYYCAWLSVDQAGATAEQFRTRFLLNSGDEINIVANEVQLK